MQFKCLKWPRNAGWNATDCMSPGKQMCVPEHSCLRSSLFLGCFSQIFSWSNVRYKILCTWTGNRKVELFFSCLLSTSHCYECDCGAGFVRQQNNVPFQQGWPYDSLELYSAVLWVRGLGVKKNTALLINLSAGTPPPSLIQYYPGANYVLTSVQRSLTFLQFQNFVFSAPW